MTMPKAFTCPECGTLVKQGPRGRSQGCVHFPPREWGWSSTIHGIKRDRPAEPNSPEAQAALQRRRRIEAIQEKQNEEREVWDE